MWYWLLKDTHKPSIVWFYLTSCIGIVHILFLFGMFVIYRDSISQLTFTITPAHMRRPIEFRVAVETIKKSAGSHVPAKKDTVSQVPQKQKEVTVAPKEQPKVSKKQLPQKEKKAPKKAVPVKSEPVKVEPVKELPKQPEKAVPCEPEHLDMQIGTQQLLHGFEQEYATLYQEIAASWSPPPGIPAGCVCTITIMIDRQGMITALDVTTSSQMPIFDLTAQASLSEFKFPRMAWGKLITITFMA